jgi:hypothetical protein
MLTAIPGIFSLPSHPPFEVGFFIAKIYIIMKDFLQILAIVMVTMGIAKLIWAIVLKIRDLKKGEKNETK